MGTKNNPAPFDCYANAEPDEPMFVLLARDPDAPELVRKWASFREAMGEDAVKVKEARDCADAMERWRSTNRGPKHSPLHTAMIAAGWTDRQIGAAMDAAGAEAE